MIPLYHANSHSWETRTIESFFDPAKRLRAIVSVKFHSLGNAIYVGNNSRLSAQRDRGVGVRS